MSIKISSKKFIEVNDWDKLVIDTYGKPYSFQQQNGCKERGVSYLTIPSNFTNDEDFSDSIPEVINGEEMGVKFDVWLNTDPVTHKTNNNWDDWEVTLFWERNFYPCVYTLANDLYNKGLIEVGEYAIDIDW